RIARPPKGVVIPRTPLFSTVGDIVALDPHKIEFRLTEPRPRAFMLGAFASGWNIIVRKKTLDEHGGNLRQVMNYPGTGPFRHVSRNDKEIWIMERNPDYWNNGLPYIDRLEVYHMFPFSPELESAFLSGQIDYARLVDQVSCRKAREMLKEHINVETNLRVVQTSVWFDEAAAGNFDLAISAIVSTLMDPSDYFSAWYGKDGPQNYSRWTNPAFHDLANQIGRELDDVKRKALVRK